MEEDLKFENRLVIGAPDILKEYTSAQILSNALLIGLRCSPLHLRHHG